jgi:hypothetical protein
MLTVTACGSARRTTVVAPPTTHPALSTTGPGATTATPDLAGALDPARVNLAPADLPAGWSATGAATGPPPAPGLLRSASLLACLGRPPTVVPVAGTPSPRFAEGAVSARSELTFVTPAAELGQEVQDLHTSAGVACLGQAVTDSLAPWGPVTDPTVQPVFEAPDGLDSVLSVHYSARTPRGPLAEDLHLYVTGSNELAVAFVGDGVPIPAGVERATLAKVLARV